MHGGFARTPRLSLRSVLRLHCPISGPGRVQAPVARWAPCAAQRLPAGLKPGGAAGHLCHAPGQAGIPGERAGFQRKSCPRPALGARGGESRHKSMTCRRVSGETRVGAQAKRKVTRTSWRRCRQATQPAWPGPCPPPLFLGPGDPARGLRPPAPELGFLCGLLIHEHAGASALLVLRPTRSEG